MIKALNTLLLASYCLVSAASLLYPGQATALPNPDTCGTTYTLPHNRWRQITLPCIAPAGENTLSAILGDDLSGTQGTDWAIFSYNPHTNRYTPLTPDTPMQPGMAYWIIQLSGSPVLLDMPDNSQPTPLASPNTYCHATGGCYEHPLASRTNAIQWQMIGAPLPGSFPASQLRIAASSCTTETGCTLQESATRQLLHDTFWSYNGTDYQQLTETSRIAPWQGYWAAALGNAANETPVLLIPKAAFGGDDDGDTIENGVDNCPATANVDQLNTDADTQGNACDPDDDNDTLPDTTEISAGTDPLNADTDGDNVTDNQDQFPLDANKAASETSAHHLLTQASFGATLDDIQHIVRIGTHAWIDEQLNLPSAYDSTTDKHLTHLERTIQIAQTAEPNSDYYSTKNVFNLSLGDFDVLNYQMAAWWENALGLHPDNTAHGKDQLRQRVAYALSQWLVVSHAESPLHRRAEGLAYYYDLLAKHAFGNYRELLGDIARSPTMGVYLSHQGNRKANPDTGTRPDENFARELMQLFSIGLYQLNLDGSPDRDNNPNSYPDAGDALIPTYTQTDIEELAKIMTGWDLANNRKYGLRFPRSGDYTQAMIFHADQHEDEVAEGGDGQVTILGHSVALNAGPDQSGLDATLDILFNHPNVGPFIARHLIMRLVTSNPSPAYIARVAQAFNNNGQGIRGDLKATVRAVLTDPEARDDNNRTQAGFGKFKEPLLAYTQLLRAFHAQPLDGWTSRDKVTPVNGVYWFRKPEKALGQGPLRANHVFNFYSPDFIPSTPYFTGEQKVAPEIQIQTEQILLNYHNTVVNQVSNNEKVRITRVNQLTLAEFAKKRNHNWDTIIIDFSPQMALFEQALEGDSNGDFSQLNATGADGIPLRHKAIDALIKHLDLLLLGNTMTAEFHQALRHFLINSKTLSSSNPTKAVRRTIREAVRFITTSSSYMTQK